MNVVKKFPEKQAADPLIKFVRAGAGVSKSSVPKLRGILVRPGTGNAILTSLSFAPLSRSTCFPKRFALPL